MIDMATSKDSVFDFFVCGALKHNRTQAVLVSKLFLFRLFEIINN
jgi:hypothetical protein